MSSNMINTIFDQEEFSILADSESFLKKCSELGFRTANLSSIDSLPKQSIIFSFTNAAAKLTFEIAKNTKITKSIFCATQVFDPSLESALYSLKLLLESDFEQTLKTQRSLLNMLNSHECFHLRGQNTNAQVTILPHAQPYGLISEDIANNFIQSVAEFFEVHYAHMNPEEPCPFSFNGQLRVSGILTVLRKPNPTLPEGMKTSLKWLSERISQKGALLTIKNNIITSLQTNSEDHIKLLNLAAGPRGLHLTEFAIGVNEAIEKSIDYRINSQLNEGICGIHLAIGDGSSGYHIDFLSPGVSVSPASE